MKHRIEYEYLISTHVVIIAMESTSLLRFVSPINCEIISRLFSRNSTFAGEPLGHHEKDTYYQIDHQMVFYYTVICFEIQGMPKSNFDIFEYVQLIVRLLRFTS